MASDSAFSDFPLCENDDFSDSLICPNDTSFDPLGMKIGS